MNSELITTLTSQTWFNLIQSIGIIVSLLFSAIVLWRDTKSRKISNYIDLVQYHRDIWRMTVENPELNRLLEVKSELREERLSPQESQFLTFVFLHITCSFELQKSNSVVKIEMLAQDISELLRAPMVRRFWEENKRYYNRDFIRFVEESI